MLFKFLFMTAIFKTTVGKKGQFFFKYYFFYKYVKKFLLKVVNSTIWLGRVVGGSEGEGERVRIIIINRT